MKMFLTRAVSGIALLGALAAPIAAQAHRPWILPSATILSGDEAWIGVDGGISEGVFEADHAALRLDNLSITAPDGSSVAPEHTMVAQWRSTFDVHLTQPGTYRIASASSGVNAGWMLNGVPGRYRGPAAGLAAAVPAGATDVVSAPNSNRIETFVTLGEPTRTVFNPTGQGIEMFPTTHPNDMVAGEPATFQLLKDGAPLANADVTIVRGGLRYRDNAGEVTVKTDADGKVTYTWPEAGMYWVNATWRPAGAPAPREGGEGPRPPRSEGPRPEGGPGGMEGMGRGGPPVASASYTAVFEVLT